MRFSIPIVGYGRPETPHAACFVDYVRAVKAALEDLGHEVVRPTTNGVDVDRTARPIVFGGQNMLSVNDPRDPGSFCPVDAILYNSEQIGAKGADPKRIFDAVKTWRQRVVWDYSNVNAEALRKMGCERVLYCPVSYHPSMTRIEPLSPEKEDIDVLFYGSIEAPHRITGLTKSNIHVLDRARVIRDLKRAGLKVEHVFGIYGPDLDPYVARAKIVLNLHYYQGAVFEIFRCSQLLANQKCIVTEDGGCDEELESFARSSMVYVPRRDIVEVCQTLVKEPHKRRAIGYGGFEKFKKTSLVENIKKALELS